MSRTILRLLEICYNLMMDEFLTVRQLLDLLHISRATLYRRMIAGEIPTIRIGRRVLFRRIDIEAWLESKRVK